MTQRQQQLARLQRATDEALAAMQELDEARRNAEYPDTRKLTETIVWLEKCQGFNRVLIKESRNDPEAR